MKPHAPPMQLEAIEFSPLRLAPGNDAFVVHEVPLYEPCGEGPHTYVRIEKNGLTTREAVNELAYFADVRSRDIGTAGQKDKHARTTQWMSLPPGAAAPIEGDEITDRLRVLEVANHGNKLRTGHVRGNRFELTFETTDDADVAVQRVQRALDSLTSEGLHNYYGPQRFGRHGGNVEKALDWAYGRARMRGKSARFKQEMYASALQSEVFNRYLSDRVSRPERLLSGEVVRLDGSRSVFVVEDIEAELVRLNEGDIIPTGPMFGPKMVRATGVAGEMEAAAERGLGLDDRAQDVVARRARGTRRDLIVRPDEARADVAGPGRVVVCFGLPSGSYATQLARELTRLPWNQPLRPPTE